MGKRIDELLKLDDTPIEHQVEALDPPGTDPRDTAWFQFVDAIDDLVESGQYGWAEETLTGIRETVERTHQVSEGQRRAVTNITDRGAERRGGRRRYEGFGRGRW